MNARFIIWAYAIVLVGLFVYPFESATDRLLRALWNWLHFPAFALLAWQVTARFAQAKRSVVIVVWVSMVLFVPALELLQEHTGRNFAWEDIWVGWAGTAVGGWLLPRRGAAIRRYAYRLVAAGCVTLLTLAPTCWVLTDRMLMLDQFPVLASFAWPGEQGRWVFSDVEVSRTRAHAGHDGRTWQVKIGESSEYPGLFMTDLIHDWSRARGLLIYLYLPDAVPLAMWVRIDDREQAAFAERYQARKTLEPGLNRIRIDWSDGLIAEGGREMTLNRIHEWGIFFESDAGGRIVYLDRVELERNGYSAGYR